MEQQGFQHIYPMDAVPSQGQETLWPETIRFQFNKRIGVNFDELMNTMKAKWGPYNPYKQHSNRMSGYSAMMANLDQLLEDNGAAAKTDGVTRQLTRQEVIAQIRQDYKDFISDGQEPEDSYLELIKEKANRVGLLADTLKEVRHQNTQQQILGSVYLNMPNNIALSETSSWGAESLGVVGALTKSAFKEGDGEVMSKMLGAATGSAGNIIAAAAGGIVGSTLGRMGIAMGGFLGAIGGGVIQKGAEAAFSVAQNPYMEMMFSGIGFRSFKFDFIFRARHQSEIEEVGRIIKVFRKHSRPKWAGGQLGKSFMEYPQEYKIQFMTDVKGTWQENKYLPKLKPCVCSNVETNFTPDNIWSAHKHGAPVAITLGLTFQETELYMADDVDTEWPDPQAKGETAEESALSVYENLVDLSNQQNRG